MMAKRGGDINKKENRINLNWLTSPRSMGLIHAPASHGQHNQGWQSMDAIANKSKRSFVIASLPVSAL